MRKSAGLFWALCGVALGSCTNADRPTAPDAPSLSVTAYVPRTRQYYVAAEDVPWNFAPTGWDSIYGRKVPGPWGDKLTYTKTRYIQYTDATFRTRVPQPVWMGILGPMIRGVVGDTIKVTFLNRASDPLSIHPHGVEYAPADEGAFYNPPRGGGDAVATGHTYTYTWFVRPEAGPQPGEPSSKIWLYHSHAIMADAEIYRGLIGTIAITDPAHARADGSPNDVSKEFVTLWMVFNENDDKTPEPKQEMNLKHAINGLFFGNLQGLTMNKGETVRWYLVGLGTEVDLHTPHWHGNLVKLEGKSYTDVVELLPASMKVGDMVASAPGRWLLHCHVGDHMDAGMYTLYNVGPSTARPTVVATQTSSNDGWAPFGEHVHLGHAAQ